MAPFPLLLTYKNSPEGLISISAAASPVKSNGYTMEPNKLLSPKRYSFGYEFTKIGYLMYQRNAKFITRKAEKVNF